MSSELLARYGRRFVHSARSRLTEVAPLEGDQVASARALALHLHSISGEAAMIGLTGLSQLARAALETVRAFESGEATAADGASGIANVLRALDELEQTLPPAAHDGR